MGSYFAMVFHPTEEQQYCVRSLRVSGFKSLEAAKAAIIRVKKDGYVKKLGQAAPMWSNVK